MKDKEFPAKKKRGLSAKKKIKLRGLRIPRAIVYFIGKMDAKTSRLKITGKGLAESAWLRQKREDFISYSARIRNTTRQINSKENQLIINEAFELDRVEERIKLLSYTEPVSSDDIKVVKRHLHDEKRRSEYLYDARQKRNELTAHLGVLVECIDLSEHETEQMLLDYRSRLECLIYVYLQGASKHINITAITEQTLMDDSESAGIYINHCVIAEHFKQELISKGVLTDEKVQ